MAPAVKKKQKKTAIAARLLTQPSKIRYAGQGEEEKKHFSGQYELINNIISLKFVDGVKTTRQHYPGEAPEVAHTCSPRDGCNFILTINQTRLNAVENM